jgi:Family of unknown function (DUF5906)
MSDVKKRVADIVDIKTRRRGNYLDRLNKRHAIVRMGAKTVVLDEQPGKPAEFMKVEDLHLWYANDQVEIIEKGKKKKIAISRLWIKNPRRRQFERVVFDPTDHNPDHFNLWHGFAVQPDSSKSCEKFLAHMKDNICSGDEDHYHWVIGFLAHMVQRPEEKAGVALVMRGGEGVGKGFFAHYIGKLCPLHYVVISQSAHLTGRFNAHHQQALLMFIDEGFWAGDKQGEGPLKHLVTDVELLIEPKHITPYMVRNLSRLIIASNEKWTVPAGTKARRWCVLDVADTHANDRAYFGEIDAEMKAGGLAGLMHVLMTFDLSTVDLHTVPKTAALLEQKEESMPTHEAWWLECLREGRFQYETGSGATRYTEETEGWPATIEKDYLWSSYALYAHRHNIRARLWPDKQLHKWLSPLTPGRRDYRPRDEGNRKRMVQLPDLGTCRRAYTVHLGQRIDWTTA